MQHAAACRRDHVQNRRFRTCRYEVDPEEPFSLANLPPEASFSSSTFADELLPARVELAELKGYTELLPNPLLQPVPQSRSPELETVAVET